MPSGRSRPRCRWRPCRAIAAVGGRQPNAGAEIVEPAHLEAVAHLPDAVEHRPVALIVGRQTPFTAQIGRGVERYSCSAR